MAICGVKKSFYAKYGKTQGSETYGYSDGGTFARLVDITVTPTSNEAELYSDDELEESDYSFTKGALKVTTSDILPQVAAAISGIEQTQDGELIYGDNSQPELGFGFIITKKKAGVDSYRAIILPRIKFKIPEDSATTKQGTITFQTQAAEAVISKDFSDKHAWKREKTFTTEPEAITYIKTFLNISANDVSQNT